MSDDDSDANGPADDADDPSEDADDPTDDADDLTDADTIDVEEEGGDAATEFAAELDDARDTLAADDLTAFHVGVVHEDESVDVSFAQVADDPRQEGLQALSLLAAHLRVVAGQAGVDVETVADDAVQLAGEVEELVDE